MRAGRGAIGAEPELSSATVESVNVESRGRGLTLGKFAPLHRGHQLVVETALAEVDELVVLVYDAPEVTSIPLPVRSGWIRTLYPRVRVLEVWDGPREVGSDPDLVRRHEECVRRVLGNVCVDRFYSSEFYGEHMSRALGAMDRRVDPGRERIPVSGTLLRQDPYAHRQWVSPVVYRDLVVNVAILGAPSTGKSTLAEHLARVHETQWMPEYGREVWEREHVGRRLTPDQLVAVARGHLEREESLLLDAKGALFCDTNALTTRVFAQAYHGSSPAELDRLADACSTRYDLTFVCGDEIPYADTWDRSGAGDRDVMQRRLLAELSVRRIPYLLLRGTLPERSAAVGRVLARFSKYGNAAEAFAQEWAR
jgi:NadR type nicotinamide-nucleotide adenylyltransferase